MTIGIPEPKCNQCGTDIPPSSGVITIGGTFCSYLCATVQQCQMDSSEFAIEFSKGLNNK